MKLSPSILLPLSCILTKLHASYIDPRNEIILAPRSTDAETNTLAPSLETGITEDSDQNLIIKDDLVCDQTNGNCYPLVFEPSDRWQVVKPKQIVPAGLDIKLNLQTGLKEAKWNEEKRLTHEKISGESDLQIDYEFSAQFKELHSMISTGQYDQSISKLDDLLEFAHDYKDGFKIIQHEFDLLKNFAFNGTFPLELREIATRLIVGCIRNNPPVVQFINSHDTTFIDDIFNNITILRNDLLSKRYVSLLNSFLQPESPLSNSHLLTLDDSYELTKDMQTRLNILEIVSKANLMDPDTIKVQNWVNKFISTIQDSNIDEWHVRNFFNFIYEMKQQYGSQIKVDSNFINWLVSQTEKRQYNLHNGLEERDQEQDSFDQKLIESRHKVFGNPMADRIKHFNDEL